MTMRLRDYSNQRAEGFGFLNVYASRKHVDGWHFLPLPTYIPFDFGTLLCRYLAVPSTTFHYKCPRTCTENVLMTIWC